jgi:predicted exporter
MAAAALLEKLDLQSNRPVLRTQSPYVSRTTQTNQPLLTGELPTVSYDMWLPHPAG